MRSQIETAVVELVLSGAYEEAAIDSILERSGTSREDFDRRFAGKEDCFLQVWDKWGSNCLHLVKTAFNAQLTWREQIRAAAYALADFLQEDPARAWFLVLGPMAAGEHARAHVETRLQEFVDLVDAGRREPESPESLTRATAEGAAGAFYGIVLDRARRGELSSIDALVRELVAMAVRPYLGDEIADEELTRPREGGSRRDS